MNNSGGHVLKAMRPPDFRTRSISSMATSGRGAKMCANWLSTTSNSPSRKGRFSTSLRFHTMSSSSAIAAFSLATASSSGVRSTPVTTAPARRALMATTPVPHPTSSTAWPGRTPAKCTSRAALGVVDWARGANDFQTSRWLALNASKGSEVIVSVRGERFAADNPSVGGVDGLAAVADEFGGCSDAEDTIRTEALKESARYQAVPTRGRVPMITEKVATELKGSVRGDVILPNDGRYDDARKVYNAMIDKRPAVVVRCTGVADVIAAVKAARAEGLAVAIRGGGHSVPG